ncbi:hypothetical protein GV791_14635 [Nocardia cyriacigeorgica]|uniref:Uncharacterized protein n=1 Tax=Nocardia cyriacigeorgica TaxID=135487 RepID=A0A6P1CPN6_9NOCA|nr:hypothetical protein [Nocardia cyriacigeorgica]NEW33792.1 hypothetical protein [Nocardia cyriacigeorgica]
MTRVPLVIEKLRQPDTTDDERGTVFAMTETPSLDELVEKASARHNGASGRRLADIAQKAGYEVSHATLNRIRRGTYTSTPTDQTLHAIAFLAGVDPQVAFSALAAQHEDTRRTADLYFRWARLQLESRRLTHEYAHAREITTEAAERELAEILEMDEDRRQGRPWTPPWDPGPEYGEGDTPWLRDWWTDDAEPDERGIYTVSLPRWMHAGMPIGTDALVQQIQHILARHPGGKSFVLHGFADESGYRTIVYLAVEDSARFRADLAEQDLQAFLSERRAPIELVVVEEIPSLPDGNADIEQLSAVRESQLAQNAEVRGREIDEQPVQRLRRPKVDLEQGEAGPAAIGMPPYNPEAEQLAEETESDLHVDHSAGRPDAAPPEQPPFDRSRLLAAMSEPDQEDRAGKARHSNGSKVDLEQREHEPSEDDDFHEQ